MLKIILYRFLLAVPTVAGVLIIVFLLLRLTPGDPVEQMLGQYANPADIVRIRTQLGLDKPILDQFYSYINGIIRFDFGRSLKNSEPVKDIILRVYPLTMLLAFFSMLFAVAFSIPMGIFSAIKHYSITDNILMVTGLLGVSIPNFWLGPMLILLFSIKLHIFNVSGFNNWYDLVLPVITLGTAMWAFLLRQTRSSVLDVYRMDYITTAYAKGLSKFNILFRHILKNALIPVVTVAGLQLGALLSGAVITERVFALPGLGDTIISAVKNRDYPVVQGAIILISLTYVIVNIFTDIIYTIIDPRIEL